MVNDPTTGPRSNHDHDCRGAHPVDMNCRTAAQLRKTYISVREMTNSHSSGSLPRLSTLNRDPGSQAPQPSTSAPSSLFGTSNFRRTDRSRVADSREGIPMQNLTPAGTSVRRGVSLGRGVASHSNSASRQRRRSCGMSWLCLGFGSNSEPGEHPEPHPGEHLHNTRQDIGDEDEEPILVPDEGPLPNPALDPAQNPSANIARQLLVKSGEIEEISGPPTDAPGQSSNGGRLPEILEEVPADDGELIAGNDQGVSASGISANERNEETELLQFARRPLPIVHPASTSGITTGLQALPPSQMGIDLRPGGISQGVLDSRPCTDRPSSRSTYSRPPTSPDHELCTSYQRRASV
ncbi:uncharacterized protein LAJ45_11365 [Morchella importuna]|uniref:uncharacterized protein n=1 Tax=Morchella importuna TaxID=1174673 RepID=UPI001E8D1F1B|nr:uncharacterized protein LAJ45_11365 [Morchella importuna]KAH8144597.1 hypothetical protein LAJ45_11365 [Morchella importuna]